MAISRRLLNDDEHVVVSTRTHVKALLLPAVVLIVVAAVAGYLVGLPTGGAKKPLVTAILLVALVVVIWQTVLPFLRWLTTTYTVTNRRLITRSGIISRRGHDIPLPRISDVSYDRGLLDRLLGCGTLILSDASQQGRVSLHDIPHVEDVQLKLSSLLYDHEQRPEQAQRLDDGT
ncbi:MAG: PH domain-containing protein [Nocardioidaceae bacterium]